MFKNIFAVLGLSLLLTQSVFSSSPLSAIYFVKVARRANVMKTVNSKLSKTAQVRKTAENSARQKNKIEEATLAVGGVDRKLGQEEARAIVKEVTDEAENLRYRGIGKEMRKNKQRIVLDVRSDTVLKRNVVAKYNQEKAVLTITITGNITESRYAFMKTLHDLEMEVLSKPLIDAGMKQDKITRVLLDEFDFVVKPMPNDLYALTDETLAKFIAHVEREAGVNFNPVAIMNNRPNYSQTITLSLDGQSIDASINFLYNLIVDATENVKVIY